MGTTGMGNHHESSMCTAQGVVDVLPWYPLWVQGYAAVAHP